MRQTHDATRGSSSFETSSRRVHARCTIAFARCKPHFCIQKYEKDRAIGEEQKQEMLASLIELQRRQGKPTSALSEKNS